MTFIEYYKKNHTNHEWMRLEELPADVVEDLMKELRNGNRKIGMIIYDSHIIENDHIVYKGRKIAYYVRKFTPEIVIKRAEFYLGKKWITIPYISCIKWWKRHRVCY